METWKVLVLYTVLIVERWSRGQDLNLGQSGFSCMPDRLSDPHYQYRSTASPLTSVKLTRKLYQAELAGYGGTQYLTAGPRVD